MSAAPVNMKIVELGRWAKVLARAAAQSDAIRIVPAYSRSEAKRRAFANQMGAPVVRDSSQVDVLHLLGGEILEVSSMASKLSPVVPKWTISP